jgi:hypothetical protein
MSSLQSSGQGPRLELGKARAGAPQPSLGRHPPLRGCADVIARRPLSSLRQALPRKLVTNPHEQHRSGEVAMPSETAWPNFATLGRRHAARLASLCFAAFFGPGGHVFERTPPKPQHRGQRPTHAQLPIKKLFGPAIPKEMVKDEAEQTFSRLGNEASSRNARRGARCKRKYRRVMRP